MFNFKKMFFPAKGEEINKLDNATHDRQEENAESEASREELKKREESIVIHTMPEKFRLNSAKLSKAKAAGIIIILAGGLLIIVVSAMLYYFLFKKTASDTADLSLEQPVPAEETKEINSNSGEREITKDGEGSGKADVGAGQATTTVDFPFLPGTEIATTTATTTDAQPDSATTTEPLISSDGDSDGDGLTDKEEALLGTNSGMVDSDGDGYGDLQELLNLYNPIGSGGLTNSDYIGEYANNAFAYSVFYPIGWSRSYIGGDDLVMFRAEDRHSISIIVQPNANKIEISEWYKTQTSEEDIEEDRNIFVGSQAAIKSEDGLIVYLTDSNKDYIYVISYVPAVDDSPIYKNVFALMIKSFKFSDL